MKISDEMKELFNSIKGKHKQNAVNLIKEIKLRERHKTKFVFETDVIRGAARPRFRVINSKKTGKRFVHTYTIKQDRALKENISDFVRSNLDDDFKPFNGIPLAVKIETFNKIPKNFSKAKIYLAELKLLRPGKKPDIDNIVKLPFDALNGVLWEDDRYIVDLIARKWYSSTPRLEITVWWGLGADIA